MDEMLSEYLPILIFLAIAVALGLLLLLSAALIAVRNPDSEKVSAYECGFNAFDDARMKFDVRFYLVSILFIIFAWLCEGCFALKKAMVNTNVKAFAARKKQRAASRKSAGVRCLPGIQAR